MGLIPDDHLQKVCKIGQGPACCSYVGLYSKGLYCVKGTELEIIIDQRRVQGTIGAMGDNCKGK